MIGAPLGQIVLDLKVQSVSSIVVSSSGLVDDPLQRFRAKLGPQDAEPRAPSGMAEDLVTQDLVLIEAVVNSHAETEQHDANET